MLVHTVDVVTGVAPPRARVSRLRPSIVDTTYDTIVSVLVESRDLQDMSVIRGKDTGVYNLSSEV